MDIKTTTKTAIKNVLKVLHLDLTQNLKYDRYTEQIINQYIHKKSVCIDVGAHKGEILDLIINNAPEQSHFAFEPIPSFYTKLEEKYGSKYKIYPYALSNEEGSSSFQFVKNAPAYSGLKQRDYKVKNPEIEKIQVQLKKLDDIIPTDTKIDLIKIDVEGAEFNVLKGAEATIKKSKPLIIFECGLGASEFYNTFPEELYVFIQQNLEMNISTLERFIKKDNSLREEEFCSHFKEGSEYYFIIHS
ncbi:FkbM family methyltransferase [Lishizhenia sp.]|uniref:FkbM family methyltransferase n=1 Tax=Lishizhenia sp. TaxID=2497594 RepID=UPI00299D750D|nr:FkbM family methyltransferase [Lishizhenia sp.]MDX1446342.1 FkbM family methyltransferase [Lishizhenia sp.]